MLVVADAAGVGTGVAGVETLILVVADTAAIGTGVVGVENLDILYVILDAVGVGSGFAGAEVLDHQLADSAALGSGFASAEQLVLALQDAACCCVRVTATRRQRSVCPRLCNRASKRPRAGYPNQQTTSPPGRTR